MLQCACVSVKHRISTCSVHTHSHATRSNTYSNGEGEREGGREGGERESLCVNDFLFSTAQE